MTKAFLSHSSSDKEFVRAVANGLGRQFCLFDEQVFDTGETFKLSIEKHLDDSSIFVLFASSESVKRMWIEFEINEAWYRILEGRISRALVFLIDSSIGHEALPPWLSRAKVSRTNAPKIVAREIRQHLDELIRTEQHPYFEGRSDDIGHLQKLLRPIGEPAPRVVGIYGLPNIGKKTFIRKTAQLILSFNRIITVQIEESDGLPDIAIKIANLLEPYSTKAGFDEIVARIKSENKEQLLKRMISDFRVAVENKEMPVLIDDGGVFTSDGFFTDIAKMLIDALKDQGELYIFLVSTRKPIENLLSMQLKPLAIDAVKRLVAEISSTMKPPLTINQISELAEYVNGYPPSAYYAVDQARAYGIDSVLADKHRLVQFRTAVFVKYINSQLMTEEQKSILLTLARYSPLPLQVLADTQGYDAAKLAGDIMILVDRSLIVPNESGLYSIAAPVADAVASEFLSSSDVNHQAIYDSLKILLDDENLELPRLDLYRLLFRASVRSGSKDSTAFHMTNDLIRLTEDYYHRRDYKRCIETAKLALTEAPKSYSARDFLIRSFIQEEQWESAESEIRELEKFASPRDVQFLLGFLERKRGRLQKAITYFLNAEKLGRSGVALKREIASCYYHNDQISEAKKYVNEALATNKDNRFVVDLSIQIAIREGDEQAARSGIEKLAVLDVEPFVKHRLSTVELRFGNIKEALKSARESVEAFDNDRPTFGILAQLATCLTRVGLFDEADVTIQRLSRLYVNQRPDIRLGLACRLEIERKRFSKALEILDNVKDITPIIYEAMRRDAIAGELAIGTMPDEKRIRYQHELDTLNKELSTYDPNEAWFTLIS
ncbi:TIR domain-containing protein [Nitrosospira lacus]|nr:TIR domain-containing protein [Nitrosospira lacus]